MMLNHRLNQERCKKRVVKKAEYREKRKIKTQNKPISTVDHLRNYIKR